MSGTDYPADLEAAGRIAEARKALARSLKLDSLARIAGFSFLIWVL
jgi:hypothetical protein